MGKVPGRYLLGGVATLGILAILLAVVFILQPGSSPLLASSAEETGQHVIVANELHVCPTGCPYSSIQAAVDAAQSGDVIKVAAGTYAGVNSRSNSVQAVYVDKTVTIRGGYTTGFVDPPDPVANATVVDAQGQGRVFYVSGSINPVIEGLRITNGFPTHQSGVHGASIYRGRRLRRHGNCHD